MVEKISIANIPVHLFTIDLLHETIKKSINEQKKITVLNANANLVQLANSSDQWLIEYFNQKVDYVFCDGAGVQLAALLKGNPKPQKITYNTWFWDFASFCAKENISIFLLGAKEDISAQAAAKLKEKNPDLTVYHHHGYFNKTHDHPENLEVIKKINNVEPNVLLVSFGMPLQEKWIKENLEKLDVNVAQAGGGALDYISGNVSTTPNIFHKLYLEWFYRLCQSPKRLWKRYTVGNVKFLYYALINGNSKIRKK